MAAIPKTYDRILVALGSIFYNPAKRYITAQDEMNAINMGAMQVSRDLGGIRLSETVVTISGTAAYPVNTQHKKLITAQYLAAGQTVPSHVAQVYNGPASLEFLQQCSWDGVQYTSDGQGIPGLITFDYTTSTVTLYPTPSADGDSVLLTFDSLAVDLESGLEYDGDQAEVMAIAYAARVLICQKLNEMNQAEVFRRNYQEEIVQCKKHRAKMNRVAQLQDGRFEVDPLRSVNGPL